MHLQLLDKVGPTAVHEIQGGLEIPASLEGITAKGFRRLIVSTRNTRRIANKPELMAAEYLDDMTAGLTHAFNLLPDRQLFTGARPSSINVVHFLRGGEAYKFEDVLWRSFGINGVHVTFYSLQRQKSAEGDFVITQKKYLKPTFIKDESGLVILTGDIVATGSTIDAGMHSIVRDLTDFDWEDSRMAHVRHLLDKELYQRLKTPEEGTRGFKPLKNLVFVTIGCSNAEEKLLKYHEVFRRLFPTYQQTQVIYLEGRFGIETKNPTHNWITPIIPGTDLLLRGGLLAPEYEARLWSKGTYALEGCRIYDGGSRAFEAEKHKMDVLVFWAELYLLGRGHDGHRLTELDVLKERADIGDYYFGDDKDLANEKENAFVEKRREIWRGTSEKLIRQVYREARDSIRSVPDIDTPEALVRLSSKKLRRFCSLTDRSSLTQYLHQYNVALKIRDVILERYG